MILNKITVSAKINAPLQKVWLLWTSPDHIKKWNSASSDWHTTKASNDLQIGGKFFSRMEAKDGSMGFDFSGTYLEVKENELLKYKLDDNRLVEVNFSQDDNGLVNIIEMFEAENDNPIELQKQGWQSILDNFVKYAEAAI